MPEITCPCGLPRPHPADGSRCWHPRYLADATDPRFTADQRAQLARFEAAEVPAEVVEAAGWTADGWDRQDASESDR